MGLFRPTESAQTKNSTMSLLKWLFVLAIFGVIAAVVLKQVVA